MTPQTKRCLFPLRAPRAISWCWWPVGALSAAVDGYFEAFFSCLRPETPDEAAEQ